MYFISPDMIYIPISPLFIGQSKSLSAKSCRSKLASVPLTGRKSGRKDLIYRFIIYRFSLMSDLMTLSIASTDLRNSEIVLSDCSAI